MNTYFDLIVYVLGGLILVLIAWNIKNELRLRKILLGKDGKDLEGTIQGLVETAKQLHTRQEDIVGMLHHMDDRLKSSIRGVELMRFNPFEDAGSNQSFAIALLDEKGDGVVLSSLYSRERMSVFAKPIKKLGSTYELSNEEKEVVTRAQVK